METTLHTTMLIVFLLLLAVDVSVAQEALTDETVRGAMELWNSDVAAAEALYGPIGSWNVSAVTKMGRLFENIDFLGKPKYEKTMLANWDTSSVDFLDGLFWEQEGLDLDLSSWDVSKVKFMNGMFWGTKNLAVNLTTWSTSNVEGMELMFRDSDNFQGIGVDQFDTSSVKSLKGLFQSTSNFNTVSLNSWNTESVTDMTFMFSFSKVLNLDLRNWKTSSVTDMSSIFANTVSFACDLANWDTSSVTDMSEAFQEATGFAGDVSGWDTSNVVDMDFAFLAADITEPLCWELNPNINLENLQCSGVTIRCECVSKEIVDSTTPCWEFTDECAAAAPIFPTSPSDGGSADTSDNGGTSGGAITTECIITPLATMWLLGFSLWRLL